MPKKRSRADDSDSDEEYVDDGLSVLPGDNKIGPVRKKDPKIPVVTGRKGGTGGRFSSKASTSAADNVLYNAEGEVVFQDWSSRMTLKPDHSNRPIWITPDCLIFMEAFSPHYQGAYDFLVAIAEPVSRPKYIHTYRLTEDSLYAAVALSINTEMIIKTLGKLCKHDLPVLVEEYIRKKTKSFGKAKLVLKDNKFHIESKYPEILRGLLKNATIKEARLFNIDTKTNASDAAVKNDDSSSNSKNSKQGTEFQESLVQSENRKNLQYMVGFDDDSEDEEQDDYGLSVTANANRLGNKIVSFMVKQDQVQLVKRAAKEQAGQPLMEEYDFKNDRRNPDLKIDLKPSTRIRSYQEKSLSKMFGNGRARSGIIVLPCGAGKSLTGVTAASTIKKNTVVVCINNASVLQWRDEFLNWTSISKDRIKIFTSSEKQNLPAWNKKGIKNEACVVISTYSMICHSGKRSFGGQQLIEQVMEREWGVMILDEVHVAPADMFQKVLQVVNAHCKLGLTATLVREDNRIKDLHFLVGPKLYEANWIDLTEQGFLAKVKCAEVWCPMTKAFYSEYISGCITNESSTSMQRMYYVMNPTKIKMCEYLLRYHLKRGDKIIIFSDIVAALILYCEGLSKSSEDFDIPYIWGGTSEQDRRKWLQMFKSSPHCNVLGLSKVGDTALDIPEANVIIQVSSQFGARRQEAQRLGRILRPKKNQARGTFNAFFYSLVSSDTREMYFSTKRQQYLIDQGYTFQVVQNLTQKAVEEARVLQSVDDEIELLAQIQRFDYATHDASEEKGLSRAQGREMEDTETGRGGAPPGRPAAGATTSRTSTGFGYLSGVDGTSYSEFNA